MNRVKMPAFIGIVYFRLKGEPIVARGNAPGISAKQTPKP